jgi:hypothetical protein
MSERRMSIRAAGLDLIAAAIVRQQVAATEAR